jgi:hypothetical protein
MGGPFMAKDPRWWARAFVFGQRKGDQARIAA